MGYSFGATQLVEGIVGTDFATGNDLVGLARWVRGGEGALALGLSIYAVSSSSCFADGTEVATEEGWTPIEELEPGDLVWASDPGTGSVSLVEVLECYRRTSDHLLILTVGDDRIETTSEHPFWVVDEGWTKAGQIEEGDLLRTLDGGELSVTNVAYQQGPVAVYNLHVAGAHTYFVSSEKVLVHNCRISRQKQARHIPATKEWAQKVAHDGGTSVFFDEASGNYFTKLAWAKGTRVQVPGQVIREFEFGFPVGYGRNGGFQTRVRVVYSKTGIHGYPYGPEIPLVGWGWLSGD